MRKSQLDHFIKNPNKSLITLSLPVIASAIVETLYTVVDAIFVGRIGPEALAAITFAWPFFFMLVAISLGINIGISSRISRFIGEKNKKKAENTLLHGLLICLAISLIIAIIFIPSLKFVFSLTGATGNVLQMSTEYMFFLLIGIVFMFLSYAITNIFSAQGDTKTAMKIDLYSLGLNIILDPILIFGFHMGVKGAAIATTLLVLFALILSLYYMQKLSYLRLDFKFFKFSKPITKEIIYVGIPATMMLLVVSFSAIFLNKAISNFGVNTVAVFGIINRLGSISTLPLYGLSVGSMTLAGMFYGAKKYKLLEKISWHAIKIGLALSAIVAAIVFIFPHFFIMWFTSDQTLINLGIPYIRLDIITYMFMAITMIIGRIMQGMGFGYPGLVINITWSLIITVPLAYIFVYALGLGYLSIAIADIIGGATAATISIIWLFKKIKEK